MKNNKSHKNYLKLFEPLIISFIWILLFVAPLLLGQFEDEINWDHVFKSWISYLPILLLFLLNRFVLLPKLFLGNMRLMYLISVSSLILFMTTLSYVNEIKKRSPMDINSTEQRFSPNDPVHRRPPLPGNRPELGKLPPLKERPLPQPIPPYFNLLILSVLVISFDTGLRVSFKLVETEQEKAKLEKENVGTQLAFLRNQVSPHFFMNTLNNIHSLIDLNTEEAKESIIQLSRLMRHLLYDSEIEDIPITKEIEFVRNYVDLMKLRFSDKVEITLDILNPLPQKTIPPLLFTSFIENAFKHGISYQHSSFIKISFSYLKGNLIFEISNSNHQIKNKERTSGIGIENSRKRLELIYGDKYDLQFEDQKNKFSVHLSIPA